jgi:DNA-binding NtrC family response regulator
MATHGGTVRLLPDSGHGAAFEIDLPVGHVPKTRRSDSTAGVPDAPIVGKRVLVVDDEATLTALLADILAEDGHAVETARTGVEATELLARRTFDVVVSDIRMPDMDGPTFYHQVEARFPSMAARFVFMTGDSLRVDTAEFLDQVHAPRLEKPFRADAAREAVQIALRSAR